MFLSIFRVAWPGECEKGVGAGLKKPLVVINWPGERVRSPCGYRAWCRTNLAATGSRVMHLRDRRPSPCLADSHSRSSSPANDRYRAALPVDGRNPGHRPDLNIRAAAVAARCWLPRDLQRV